MQAESNQRANGSEPLACPLGQRVRVGANAPRIRGVIECALEALPELFGVTFANDPVNKAI